ncbi:fumarylacetoacetate hydrolase family protein [Gordonia sp. zg691]|uniref:fumarylacetoacetate hydrolase family protein n=1 Tax=Gordonia jinghuaiqii TaxID=2758710 RepID=UPI0016627D4E|nr:fumarylacetoacetate hydrolase family protein [Gordonia jinghuaiqii]MBD0859669.1 fumarylacetoacetate hydrolase family protein [Gordonia jinghuaiqii]
MDHPLNPRTVWGTAGNYPTPEQSSAPPRPQLFIKNSNSVIGDGEPIRLSGSTARRVVCEGELAVVIGRECRRLASLDEAREAIAGYTVANDVTARDLQAVDGHWARAKGLDGFCPLGADLITPRNAPAWRDAVIRTTLDGRLVQETPVAKAYVGPEALIMWASAHFTLHPGDVFLVGTPDYLLPHREDAAVLRPGNTVQIRIEGIGTITTPVV